jgi:dCMP deaminase
MSRPSWPQYFLEIAKVVSSRSTCTRRRVGAVVVRDKRILTTGYNGVPSNVPHCADDGCVRAKNNIPSGERMDLCNAIHAEANSILQAAYSGINLQGSTIYVTTQPCINCARMIINAGIKSVVYEGDYPDEASLKLLQVAGITVHQVKK